MPCPIRLESQDDNPQTITEAETGTIGIGREPENTVQVDSDAISRRHGYLFNAGSQWLYCDLGSTNGSWVSSVKVEPGQLRLLRSGDVIQLADFTVRFFHNTESAALGRSVLVFFNNQFQEEIDMAADGARFVIGGPEADREIDGRNADRPDLVLAAHGGVVEATVGKGGEPVHVGGMAIAGVSAVADRDEITVGPYRLVVNDAARAQAHVHMQQAHAAEAAASSGASFTAHDNADDDWDRPQKHGVGNYVFGSPMGDEDVTGTINVPTDDFRKYSGLPNRFSTNVEQVPDNSAAFDRLLILLGVTVFIAVIIVVLIIFLA